MIKRLTKIVSADIFTANSLKFNQCNDNNESLWDNKKKKKK